MVKSAKEGNGAAAAAANPEAEERKRLKKLAISSKLLAEAPPPAKASSVALTPSKTVTKHHGRDILRKSNRKNRFLFSFPGLLAPISAGGKIGELKDLGSKNPVLYLDFPQGQMKLFGTIIYPKNRYLTLQFSRGGKNVVCEDYFDTLIVFSEAWWIGRKDENPDEVRLAFPEDLNMGQQPEYDFKGGAGSTSERIRVIDRDEVKLVKQQSPKREKEYELSDSQNDLKDLMQVTPTRHSARTASKTYKFAETSSGDDSDELNTERSEEEDKASLGTSTRNQPSGKTERSFSVAFNIDDKDAEAITNLSEQLPQSTVSATKSKDPSCNSHSSLVQSTISTLFKKVEEKKAPGKLKPSSSSKVSNKNLLEAESNEKTDQAKKRTPRTKGKAVKQTKAGNKSTGRRKQPEVEDDEIEEYSSTSKDTDGSDEDWGT